MCVWKQKKKAKEETESKRQEKEKQTKHNQLWVTECECDMCEYAILSAVKIEKENVKDGKRRAAKRWKAKIHV